MDWILSGETFGCVWLTTNVLVMSSELRVSGKPSCALIVVMDELGGTLVSQMPVGSKPGILAGLSCLKMHTFDLN